MNIISANDLKTKGVSTLEDCLKNDPEVLISVHGKNRYVVMSIETYQHMRELELQAACAEVQQDLKQGKFHRQIKKHLEKITVDKKKCSA